MNSPQVQLREFQFPEDYGAICQLWESMDQGVRFGRSDTPEKSRKKLTRDPDLSLAAEQGTKIIGTVVGGFDGHRGILYHPAVEDSFRGRGIGSLLLNEIESRLRLKRCLKCYLMVTPDNEEAMRYYEQRGWHNLHYVRLYSKDLDLK